MKQLIENADDFESFVYKDESLGDTIAQPAPNQAYEIVKNAVIAVSLKYFNDFLKSLEMPYANCKIELKPKWIKYCALFRFLFFFLSKCSTHTLKENKLNKKKIENKIDSSFI